MHETKTWAASDVAVWLQADQPQTSLSQLNRQSSSQT